MIDREKEDDIMSYGNKRKFLGIMMILELMLAIATVGGFFWTFLSVYYSDLSAEILIYNVSLCICMYLAGFVILYLDGELRNKWGIR